MNFKEYFLQFLIILTIFIFVSCNGNKSKTTTQNTNDSIAEIDKKIVSSIGETLSPEALKLVANWQEYTAIDELLEDFYSTNTDEVLLKAKNLSNASLQLRDSIRIKQFERPDIKIRLNVLYNHSLRLSDMESIQTITDEEVKTEVLSILDAFSALNGKINNIIKQESLEKELTEFN